MFWVVILPLCAMAQDDFTADRPGYINSVDVLPKGRWQWETAVGYERDKIEEPATTTWTVNTSTLRWGFSDMAELRLQGSYLQSSCDGEHYGGFSDLAVGTKVRLIEGEKAVPTISFLGNLFIPGGSDHNYLPEHVGGQMALVFCNQLSSWCYLSYEGNLTWMDSNRPTLLYGASLCFDVSDRISLLVDEYNINTDEGTDCWTELGAAYQLSPRLQLDIATDLNLQHLSKYCSLSLGVSWQITK